MANWHHTARNPRGFDSPSLTHRYTPPDQPDASSAETSEVGSRNTIAGTRYRNTQARPYTAMVGAARRLATEAVVIIARVTQVSVEEPALAATVPAAFPCGTSSGTGTSAALKGTSGSTGADSVQPRPRSRRRRLGYGRPGAEALR